MGFGFFHKADQKLITTKSTRIGKIQNCGQCGLWKNCRSPKMPATGDGQKGILIVAEAPGETEDRRNKQLIGAAGKLLRGMVKSLGLDLDVDFRKINAINCRPPDNRTPTKKEIACCRPMVMKEIERFKPKMIILMGGVAVESVLGRDGGIFRWRGSVIPDRDFGCWVAPMFHPSFVLRSDGNPAVEKVFLSDLKRAVTTALEQPFPVYKREQDQIEVLDDWEAVNDYLKKLNLDWFGKFFAFDYETTGLKPHAKGHRIVTCSICSEPDRAVAFSMNKKIFDGLRSVLRTMHLGKIAANMKFEDTWSIHMLGTRVNNWVWDTMLAAHFLDNREKQTSLKYQAYIRYGTPDYDSHIQPYLEGKEKNNANSLNRILELNRQELLVYNGIDSLLEYRLALDQAKEMGMCWSDEHCKFIRK